MILAPDRSKLSKRHGATAVSEFISQGYLPEAFVNFLAYLGWSSPDGEEIKPLDEIVKLFSLDRVSLTGAIFEFDKLNWMNGTYIRNLPIEDITERAKAYLKEYDLSCYTDAQLCTMVDAVRNNLTRLDEIKDAVSYFFGEGVEISDEVRDKVLKTEETRKTLPAFLEFAEKLDFNNVEKLHEQLGEFREQMKPIKPKQSMWAVRAALTGRTGGADLAVVLRVASGTKEQGYRKNESRLWRFGAQIIAQQELTKLCTC